MVLKTEQSHIAVIIGLILLFVLSPLITAVIVTVVLAYYYFSTGSIPTLSQLASQLASIWTGIDRTTAWAAVGFMLATLAVHYTKGYETYFGFPSTVITYYHYPVTDEVFSLWNILKTKILVNVLEGFFNVIFYYFAIRFGYRLWFRRNKK
ncbi:MAG: hypothetical protein R3A44_12625 [Caldilineaceae bacterium]